MSALRSSSRHWTGAAKTDQVQAFLGERYVDPAQFQVRRFHSLGFSVLLALLDPLMIICSLSSGSDQGNEIRDGGTKLLDFAIVDLEEEKLLGFLGETTGSVRGVSSMPAQEKRLHGLQDIALNVLEIQWGRSTHIGQVTMVIILTR